LHARRCNRRRAGRIYLTKPPFGVVENVMQQVIVPVVLFLCITYAIKLLIDARLHSQMFKNGASEAWLESILKTEERQRRYASLRWGVVLLALAAGFGLNQYLYNDNFNAGSIAILAGAVGLGNLVFFGLSRHLD
jgi:hypothetical protein